MKLIIDDAEDADLCAVQEGQRREADAVVSLFHSQFLFRPSAAYSCASLVNTCRLKNCCKRLLQQARRNCHCLGTLQSRTGPGDADPDHHRRPKCLVKKGETWEVHCSCATRQASHEKSSEESSHGGHHFRG